MKEFKLSSGEKFKVSNKDAHLLKIFPWWRKYGGYVRVARKIKTDFGFAREDYYLHVLIVGKVKGFEIDHKNRKKFDCRRENLRLASRGENCHNKDKAVNCTSKYRGVTYRAKRNKKNPWMAYISKDGKQTFIGYFSTERQAAKKYDEKAVELWGEFAYQNIP